VIGRSRLWLLAIVVLSMAAVNPYVRGDGNGYYAWLVSVVIDHDLDFRNQYARADPLFRDAFLDPDGQPWPDQRTSTGHVRNQWSVGPALLWAPAFLVAHAGVTLARAAGSRLSADGYAWPYRWACAMSTALYGWVGLLLARRIAIRLGAGARTATLATIGVWLATPLVVYQYFLPFHVHALAAFSVALFLWCGLTRPLTTVSAWAVWGLTAGLMTTVYPLNAVLLIVVPFALWDLSRAPVVPDVPRARVISAMIVFALAAACVLVPQMAAKAWVYGSPFTIGYQDQFFWLDPRLRDTLFSSRHGLFLWTPLTLVAVVGLVLVARRRRQARPILLASLVFFYIVASYQNWHGESSFGNRFFVSLTAPMVIGVCGSIAWVTRSHRVTMSAAVAGLAVLSLWNAGLAFQWGTKLVPSRDAVDMRRVAAQQFTVVPIEIGGFLRRYFTARTALTAGIEQEDIREWNRHQPGR
jgi:hypothetical protein